eukprot:CAMPEP_0201741790 /NCGR_PEP_ID=MMETSP0593-20130828/46993_1 /ASSEMBLY_ACC=CAM_ASM_000672 /TAXON_ID=267983 /ORGANISM="Skeletonema japonicum, Strain CCMP2506" /LENGTH=271 /DNA_ID=CAMNT_0048236129 /DNA_START=30 /DNA_END=842 /DNA_ORIENTATION=+
MMSTNPNEAVSDMYDTSLGSSSSSHHRQQHSHHQQQHNMHQSPPPLASKPHAFRGAVLSPDHARNLTPDKALQLASALSAHASAAASTKGVLPPGEESVNLFQGCDMVELLAGISIGGSSSANNNTSSSNNASNSINNNSSSVFRNAPPSPKSPVNNPQHARIINLLHQGVGGMTPPTPKNNSTTTNNANNNNTTNSSPMSMNSTTATYNDSSNNIANNTNTTNNNIINPLSLLSTVEALESYGAWRTHYTVWITEAWNILQWSEPSAALF